MLTSITGAAFLDRSFIRGINTFLRCILPRSSALSNEKPIIGFLQFHHNTTIHVVHFESVRRSQRYRRLLQQHQLNLAGSDQRPWCSELCLQASGVQPNPKFHRFFAYQTRWFRRQLQCVQIHRYNITRAFFTQLFKKTPLNNPKQGLVVAIGGLWFFRMIFFLIAATICACVP